MRGVYYVRHALYVLHVLYCIFALYVVVYDIWLGRGGLFKVGSWQRQVASSVTGTHGSTGRDSEVCGKDLSAAPGDAWRGLVAHAYVCA